MSESDRAAPSQTEASHHAASLAAFLADRDVECPSCGYQLRGVNSTACPECGRVLRINDLRSSQVVLKKWVLPALIAVIALALVPFAVWMARSIDSAGTQDKLYMVLSLAIRVAVLGVPALIWFNSTRQRWARWRCGAFVHRWSCHTLIVICLSVGAWLGGPSQLVTYVVYQVPLVRWSFGPLFMEMSVLIACTVCYVAMCIARTPDSLATWTTRTIAVLFTIFVGTHAWRHLWFLNV